MRDLKTSDKLIENFAYFTDCQIASYEQAVSLSRFSEADRARHAEISVRMLEACERHGLEADVIARLRSRYSASKAAHEERKKR